MPKKHSHLVFDCGLSVVAGSTENLEAFHITEEPFDKIGPVKFFLVERNHGNFMVQVDLMHLEDIMTHRTFVEATISTGSA